MKKRLFKLNVVLFLVMAIICLLPVGHVAAQIDSQKPADAVIETETDENQSTKVILQSSEESLETTLQENNENYEKVGDDTYIVDFESADEAAKAVYDTYSNDDSVTANEDALFFTMTEDGTDGTENCLPETENTEESIPSEIPETVPSENTTEETTNEPTETAQPEVSAVPEETEISPAEEPVQTEQEITDWHAYAESLGKKLVAVIDTGVSSDYASVQMNFTDEADKDENGHGTEVAKAILENSNDSAVIMSLKAMGKEGTGYMSNIMKAIQYAKDQHADIINMSISAPDNGSADIFKQLIRDTIAEGTQFVAAAGNYNSSAMVYIPSDIEGVISVGAADENGRKTDTSNYGATYYETADSTSMASAIFCGKIVSGADLSNSWTNDTITFDRTEINPAPFREGETKTSYNEETDVHTVEHTSYINISPDMYRHAYETGAKYWIFSEQAIEKNLSHFMDSSFDKVYGNNFWFYDSEESFNADVEQGTKAKAEFTADRIEEDIFSTQTLWGNQSGYLTAGIDYTGQGNGNAYMSLTRRCSARMNRYWIWYANQGGTEHWGGGNGTYESASGEKTLGRWTDGGKYGTISINGQIKAVYGGSGWNGTTYYHSTASTSYNTGNVASYTVNTYYYYYYQNKTWKHFDTRSESKSPGSSFSPYNVTAPNGYHAGNNFNYFTTGNQHLGDGTVGKNSITVNQNINVHVHYYPNTYKITYDANGGTGAPGTQSFGFDCGEKISSTVPTRTGYTFVDWTYSGNHFSPGASIPTGWGNFKLTANWKANSYTFTLDPNGGTLPAKNTVTKLYGAKYNLVAGEGHYNESSSSEVLGYGSYNFGRKLTAAIKVKFDDFSTNPEFFDNFESGGFGFGMTDSGKKLYFEVNIGGKYVAYMGDNPLKTGQTYWLTGVFDGDSSTLQLYINGSLFSGSPVEINSRNPVSSFNGSIQVSKANISLNGNPDVNDEINRKLHGTVYKAGLWTSVLSKSQITDMVNSNTLPSSALINLDYTPVRPEYTFLGWYTDINNSGTKITPDTAYAGNSKITAKWQPNSYSISYNLNGGSISGQPTSYNIESSFTLPAPTKNGYTFTGWTGTGLSGATKTVTVAKGSKGNRSYTANWTPTAYSISYNLNGGTISGQQTSYNIESDAFTLPTPGRAGYTFTGWTGTGLSGATKSVTVAKGSAGNRSYTANWSANTYTYNVVYKSSSGKSLGTGTTSGVFGSTKSVVAPAKNGYSTPSAQDVKFDSVNAKAITFTYVPVNYSISYNLNGSSVNGNPEAYNIESAEITLKNPAKNGYTFAGWTGSNGSTAQTTVKIPAGSTGNKSYTANWSVNNYYLDLNGSFDGTGGSSISHAKADVYINGSKVSTGVTDYYAQHPYGTSYKIVITPDTGYSVDKTTWEGTIAVGGSWVNPSITSKKYTVTYNSNGGTGTMGASTATFGKDFITQKNAFARTGYTFNGWNEKADGTGSANWSLSATGVYESGNSWKWSYDHNITLYAQWKVNSYSLAVNPNGGTYKGTGNTTTINANYDSKQEINEIPTRNGYEFTGWSHSGSGVLHSGNASSKSSEITQTEKSDTDGTAYTNYSLNLASNTQGNIWPNVGFFSYPYESGHTYRVSYDVRVNSVSGLRYATMRHSAFGNNWEATSNSINAVTSGWSHRTMDRTFTGTTVTQAGTATAIAPFVEFYCAIDPGSTGKFSFDLKNLSVYDVTAGKYVASKTAAVKNGASVDMGAGNTTLTAHWKASTYSISYDLNGGSISGQPTSYNIESNAFALPAPSRTGYTFTGWTGTGLSSATKSVTVAKGSTGNRSYTANWSVNSYTLDLNGILDGTSSGGLESFGTADIYINGTLKGDDISDFCQAIPYGSSYEIKDIKAAAGHVYAGTDQALKGTMGTSRVNISLKFNTKKTTVNFMRNYSSSDATKSSETYTYGTSGQSFSNRGYSRTGYTLLGWAESQTATKENYSVNCGVAASWIDAHYPSINLYAVWSKNTYKISYGLNGGSVSGNPDTYQIDTADITLKNPTKTGYTFTGWSGTGITGTSMTVTIPKGSTENRSYTANWKINQYDIVIKGDKGTESITYGGKTYPLTTTNYVTIHADYGTNTAVTYKVKKGFHIVSETGTSMSNTQQTWTNNAGNEGSAGGQTWATCAFTRTITVNTAQNKFVLSFGDGNGGTSGSQNATFGNGEKVTFNAEKKPGYTFKNWNTKTDGTGTSYPDGVSIDKIDASNGSTVTLYPIYRPNVLTFHFYANGADTYRSTLDEKTHTVPADEKANKMEIALTQNAECMKYDETVNSYGIVDAQRLSRTGYKSNNKWHADSVSGVLLDASNGIYAKTQDIAEAAGILQKLEDSDTDINLYADWLANTYTVKFDANGGSGNPVTQKMTYDKDATLTPASYTRTKHRFLYWTENADGSGKKYADKASVKNLTATANGTVPLYAQWENLTDLKIMNTVSGNMGNRAKEFEFSTAFPACFQNRKFTVIKGDGTKETVTIGADGIMKFSLKHGETFTFTDLDTEQVNAIKNLGNRDIIESDYTAEGYRTTYAASTEDDGTLCITYSNSKNSGVPTGNHIETGVMATLIIGLGALMMLFKKKKDN